MERALAQTNFADLYEQFVVPAIFDRYARDLVERARPIGPADRVLDLGCGTGIVTRVLRERLGGAARVIGLDANPQMIAKARQLTPEVDWHEGNAMALPFPDASFDLVLCQEMLQFANDRAAALREVLRVLAPGGRLLISTWRPRAEQPFHDALGKVAERHLGASNDKRWSLDGGSLRALLSEAGFVDVQLEVISLIERHAQFNVRMNALAANFDLTGLTDEEREHRLAAVERDSAAVMAAFLVDGMYTAPTFANVASARRPQ